MAVDHIAESSRRNAASASNDEGAPKSGRVVFLAQPARDMEQAYMRLATEFRGRGYGVAPDPRSGIFNGRAAEQFVDQALNGAEFSVHLIGAEETPIKSSPCSSRGREIEREPRRRQGRQCCSGV